MRPEISGHKTPFYLYEMNVLEANLKELKRASDARGYKVHYAVKANANQKILQKIRSYGFGADCVSGGEVQESIKAGFEPDHIVFAGVGKNDDEIRIGLENDIFCFNVESAQEVSVIAELAENMGKRARIAIRIKPNVDARTHKYITTGLEDNKFGIDFHDLDEVLPLIQNSSALDLIGIHFHIGSQITDMDVFRNLCLRVNEIQKWFESRKIEIPHLNLGGGLGLNYNDPDEQNIPDYEAFFQTFEDHLVVYPGQQIHFELGRAVVANCGSLISKVLYVKTGIATNFLILDAGMTELIRPALYQSYHKIENWSSTDVEADHKYDVVGPICESSDCFGKAVMLPESHRGDLIAIRSSGAYGEVMSSSYNIRPKAEAIYV